MAKPRAIEGLRAEQSYASAGARIVAVRAQEVLEHSRNVLDVTDIERVHDMRVATRRLRAALEFFKPCFPKGEWKDALREVKAIADALGERRDSDVAIAALEEFGAGLGPAERPGISSLVEGLRAEQARANTELLPFVDRERLEALARRLDGLSARAEGGVA